MKAIVVDKAHPILSQSLSSAGIACSDWSGKSDKDILKELKSCDGLLLRGRFKIDRAFYEQYSNLKFIGRIGSGMEHIDRKAGKQLGVAVFSSPEGNAPSVAEHALAMLLSLLNKLNQANAQVREGQWLRNENEGEELGGKTIGIIGYGNTGSAFGAILRGFDVRVLAYDKYKTNYAPDHVEEVDLQMILEEADVISFHLPLTHETTHMLSTKFISELANPAIVINTSRGGIANTADVLAGLDAAKLRGACLDVLEYERENLTMPPMEELPDTFRALIAREDVILSPHVAGFSPQSFRRLSEVLATKIIHHFGRA